MPRALHCSLRAASCADLCVGHRLQWGSPGHIHIVCKELLELLPNFPLAPGQWMLGFGVQSLALAPRSLPWYWHNGQRMDFATSGLLLINTTCIYPSGEFGV